MRWYGWIVVVVVIIIGGTALVNLALDDPELATTKANVMSRDLEVPAVGFTQVTGDYEWQFPQDYDPHPDFQREQWEIQSGEDCHISWSVVFDRASFVAEAFAPKRESAWAMNSILQATLTIEDNQNGQNIDVTRSSRMAVGLAGTDEDQVWVEDWVWNWSDGILVAVSEDAQLELTVTNKNEAIPINETRWNGYTMAGQANGEMNFSDQTAEFSCTVTLTHRFGS